MMNVLITGGAGFIGSHLVDAYLEAGHTVTVVDNLATGDRSLVNPKATFVEMDICRPEFCTLIEKGQFDLVNHHAAQIDVRVAVDNPAFDAEVNILGSMHCIQGCLAGNVSRLIFISSGGAIYGEIADKDLPVPETYPVMPLSPYGESKYTVERYLFLFRQLKQLDYCVLRYGNVYGERQGKKGEAGVVSIFAREMLKPAAVTVFGDGNQLRDYVHVADVVRANMMVSNLNTPLPESSSIDQAAYNIGTGEGLSVNHMVQVMEDHLQTGLAPAYAPPREGEIQKTFLDCTKAKKEMNWEAQVSFSAGINRTVDWFRDNPQF